MKYMTYGKTGMEVSRFGFGCMRFPKKEVKGETVIDQEETTRMIRYALDQGVNYFDTAYLYGGSEEALGKAFKEIGVKRDEVVIVAKNPVANAKTREDMEAFLEEELRRLQTDYIDVYFLHALNKGRWEHAMKLEALKFLEDKIAEGKVRFGGFSFHGDVETFETIVDAWDWSIVQIQLNFLDTHHQAGMRGLKYLAAREIPAVIMEPLRGGALTQNIPPSVQKAYDDFPVKRTPAEWAFRYLIDMPEVTCVISGVSTMEQLEENVRIFSDNETGCLDNDERALIEKVTALYKENNKIGCTRCEYCLPCPQGINIPEIFQLWNDTSMESYVGHARFQYSKFIVNTDFQGADRCVRCGICETKCPQELKIMDGLQEAHKALYKEL